MFVPVACSQCGKPFQVPEEAVGKPAACPWCQAAVLALPVGGAPPPLTESATPARPEPAPLSLDDDGPAPAAHARNWRGLVVLALIAVAVTLLTVAALRRKEGYLLSREWGTFTPPDHSCTIDLAGTPVEDTSTPGGEQRYLSEGWYSGVTTWIAWRDLNAAEAQAARSDEAWHDPQLLKLFDAQRDWMRERFGGSVAKDATIQFKVPLTREVRLDRPGRGCAVERLIVHSAGPHPRLYSIGIAGKRLDPEGDAVRRLFDSFRVLE